MLSEDLKFVGEKYEDDNHSCVHGPCSVRGTVRADCGTNAPRPVVDQHDRRRLSTVPAVEVMSEIKRTLDPENRMNPGKMFSL